MSYALIPLTFLVLGLGLLLSLALHPRTVLTIGLVWSAVGIIGYAVTLIPRF